LQFQPDVFQNTTTATEQRMSRTTERLIQTSGNRQPNRRQQRRRQPGEFLAELCRESAERPAHQRTIVEALVS
jgi:hypothetical protein